MGPPILTVIRFLFFFSSCSNPSQFFTLSFEKIDFLVLMEIELQMFSNFHVQNFENPEDNKNPEKWKN